MDEIVTSLMRVTDIMGEIMTSAEEPSAGIEKSNRAVAQMDQVTQQNAALVEEAAAAAGSLEDRATGVKELVSVFRTGSAAPTRNARTDSVRPARAISERLST